MDLGNHSQICVRFPPGHFVIVSLQTISVNDHVLGHVERSHLGGKTAFPVVAIESRQTNMSLNMKFKCCWLFVCNLIKLD